MTGNLEGKLIADKYRVGALISESDTGDLYRGVHEFRGFPIMLEILPAALAMDKRWSAKFLERARTTSSLDHDNILAINDFGEDAKGVVYAAYEPIDGITLADVISTGQIGQVRALDLTRQLALALQAAHDKQIIHGRLDPKTIFVTGDDRVKAVGFGGDNLSVPRDADPKYLSPEQCSEYPVADARSDVYTLGVILFEMLSGETPFVGRTRAEVLSKQGEPPLPLSAFRQDLHNQIEPVILTALARDPDFRYQTVAAFVEDLDRISAELGGVKAAAAAVGGTPRRNVWQTAFIALAGIVLLAGALIYATSVRSTDPTATLAVDADSLPVQPINPATGAQEEALLKNGPLGDPNAYQDPYLQNGQLPGGDGYNAWANGGFPPAGAPLPGSVTTGPLAGSQVPMNGGVLPPQAIAPPGQTVTVPNGGSVFMPNEGGVILVPVPRGDEPAPTPTPKNPAANTSVKNPPVTSPTPKPLATPLPRSTDKPATDAAPAAGKPVKKGKPGE